jgi:AraC family L-rhamnose operon regulatory protein RhaS
MAGAFMEFFTVGFKYYIGYKLPMAVTEELADLERKGAGEYYKIIFLKSGTNHFLLNGKEFILIGACTICLNEIDRIEFLELQSDLIRIVWFTPAILNNTFNFNVVNNSNSKFTQTEQMDLYYILQFLHGADASSKILSLHTIDSSLIEQKIQLLSKLLLSQESNYWPCRSRSYLFEILFSIARQEEDEDVHKALSFNGNNRLVVDVIYYLQAYYNKKITIEGLAEMFHTNRTTLLTNFKEYTGESINQYLIKLRINMAATFLRDTELSVDEICERTGFHDISYFSKVFKKVLHYTPTQYRKVYSIHYYS